MEELSIKIKIAEREYPMKVKRDEEEKVRAAGKLINEKLKHYKEQFGIDDKQDLLAMVAFDTVVQKQTSEEDHRQIDQTVFDKVSHLNQMVSQAIL
jgi:cell division protein ZapA